MRKYDRVKIAELAEGDRFYLLSDKDKEMRTKVALSSTQRHMAITDKDKRPQPFNKGTMVVYLRSGEITAQ